MSGDSPGRSANPIPEDRNRLIRQGVTCTRRIFMRPKTVYVRLSAKPFAGSISIQRALLVVMAARSTPDRSAASVRLSAVMCWRIFDTVIRYRQTFRI